MTTCASRKEADSIIAALLKKRLIACANVMPGVESRFWWKGKIDKAKEFIILIKAVRKNFNAIEKAITWLHSYEVPEIIAIPIIAGSKGYLKWIDKDAGT